MHGSSSGRRPASTRPARRPSFRSASDAGMRRYFGTDGVRGIVGEDLTPDLVERLGRAATLWSKGGRVFVGRDTRGSGPELEEAFARGVVDAGGNAVLAGVLPTPAVATDSYLEHITERFGSALSGLRVVVDCANGAYSAIAPTAFEQLGAEVTAIAAQPDGSNINLGCGATDLSLLQRTILHGDFDLGVAFDGDGDRMLAVDANGAPVDGDPILAILADDLGVD